MLKSLCHGAGNLCRMEQTVSNQNEDKSETLTFDANVFLIFRN